MKNNINFYSENDECSDLRYFNQSICLKYFRSTLSYLLITLREALKIHSKNNFEQAAGTQLLQRRTWPLLWLDQMHNLIGDTEDF